MAIRNRATRPAVVPMTNTPTPRGKPTTRNSTTQTSPLDETNTPPNNKTLNDKETARITACLSLNPSISNLGEEAFRLCRVNSYLRKDRQQTQDELRRERASFHSRQAVLEDAIAEMRVDYPETRMILDRAWKLLEERNVRIPPDMKIAYHVLQEPTLHDWQARNGYRADTALRTTPRVKKQKGKTGKKGRKGKKSEKGKKKEEEKVEEREKDKPMGFVLHTHEGRTFDLRNPAEDDYDDDADDESDVAMDTLDSDSDGDDDVATNAVNGNAGAALNNANYPGPDDASSQDAVALSADNVVAGVKRKMQDDEPAVQKKPRLEDLDAEELNAPES